MSAQKAKFRVGQLVRHKLFDYRGVIFDVDPIFLGTEDWYAQMARSQPPKDRPWYHVLVHDAIHTTYVAEQNIEPDFDVAPIRHPQIDDLFTNFGDDGYVPIMRRN